MRISDEEARAVVSAPNAGIGKLPRDLAADLLDARSDLRSCLESMSAAGALLGIREGDTLTAAAERVVEERDHWRALYDDHVRVTGRVYDAIRVAAGAPPETAVINAVDVARIEGARLALEAAAGVAEEHTACPVDQRCPAEIAREIRTLDPAAIANPPPLAQRYDESDEEFKARAEAWSKKQGESKP